MLPVGTHVAFLFCEQGKRRETRHGGWRNLHFSSCCAKRWSFLRPGSRKFPIPRQGPEVDGIVGVTIPRGHGETVLVVAGDSDLRGLAAALLDALGYRALEAGDAPSALQDLKEKEAADVDLLITDVVFAHAMSARDLAREARTLFPDLAVLYTSSDSDEAVRQVERLEDGAELIGRPCRTGDLARRVRAILDGRKP